MFLKKDSIYEYVNKKIIEGGGKSDIVHAIYSNKKTGYREIYLTKNKEKCLLILEFNNYSSCVKKIIMIPVSLSGSTIIDSSGVFLDVNIIESINIKTILYSMVIDSFKVLELDYKDGIEIISDVKISEPMINFISKLLKFEINKVIHRKIDDSKPKIHYSSINRDKLNAFISDLSVYYWDSKIYRKNNLNLIKNKNGFDFDIKSIEKYGTYIKNLTISLPYPKSISNKKTIECRFVLSDLVVDDFYIKLSNENGVIINDKNKFINEVVQTINEIKYVDTCHNLGNKISCIQFLCVMKNLLDVVFVDKLISLKLYKCSIISPLLNSKEMAEDLKFKERKRIINRVIYF